MFFLYNTVGFVSLTTSFARLMLLVWTTENDRLSSSFASAGSRKERRRCNHCQSMMTNSRTKMFLMQLPCLLQAFSTDKLIRER
ncbi:uncharacterized protein F5891DRAFT_515937 [Suillus fuscotomentosus]|uniref:Uncharacterized protein n=1 Tax=Suillus fuscotomentosus TaxID=1912939 RepID=A0AAD4E0Z5_9AGAM|nr:uncharacterized protein F5891DRAFT_515937 [Suillus fuscotomentosus]KAG1897743.1 hypothetical protein F5891DRAFT_515937 [Suillus fuscotomentosus]